jgi:voltage-gated potassium channel
MADRQYGNAYNLFILVLTVMSLLVMVCLWLPLSPETIELLRSYDNFICLIFLLDFMVALRRAASPWTYLLYQRGWLDLLGSVPSFGIAVLGLVRLARISRLRAISRGLGHQSRAQLVSDLLRNRAQYAVVTTSLTAFFVLTSASLIVLEAEIRSSNGNIRTGSDAFWWAMVTITTVGYGDHYPTTAVGRLAAMFVMVIGIGIIASLASVLGRVLVDPRASDSAAIHQALDRIAADVGLLREQVESTRRATDGQSATASHPQTPAQTQRFRGP